MSTEIVPVEETNHSSSPTSNNPIQHTPTNNLNNKENSKQAVVDQPKPKKESSKVTTLCLPFKSKQENSKRESVSGEPGLTEPDPTGINCSSSATRPNEGNANGGGEVSFLFLVFTSGFSWNFKI